MEPPDSGEPRPGRLLVSPAQIALRVVELAADIDRAYLGLGSRVVLLCVLKGSLFFTADLARALSIPLEIDAIAVRSYGAGTESTGTVQLVKDVTTPLGGRHVLMVEDVIDTGLTTSFLYEHVERHRPASLRLVTLLDKPGRRRREVRIDFRGFTLTDEFVVGYGLDLDERFRNLSGVHALDGG
ncbi:MAG TPA: hypoxanthine phosphoribosyltransferase [Candidatus Dormibacteraeota bacterium]|jgi:hypoxanthine phosphoribosyltransferase|nr:hypoxanthine phosphoribosyltransferase [Candidatus Dormibacteraeota bacterium]